MNEQLQETVNTILTKALSIADETGEFLVEQVPDVVNQLLIWEATASAIGMASWIIIVFLYSRGCVRLWNSDHDVQSADVLGGMVIFGILMSLLLLVIIEVSFDWLKILVAPKLYLLEYAATLVK